MSEVIKVLTDDTYHPLSRLFYLLSIDATLYSNKSEVKHRIWENIREEQKINGSKNN